MSDVKHAGGRWAGLAPQLRGVLLVALGALSVSVMHATIRRLSGDLHPFEIAFFRNLLGLLFLVPLLARRRAHLRTRQLGRHLARALLQLVSMLAFFTALSLAPLARVSAMSFTAPLFATIGAVVFLRERIHIRRVLALVVGFAGAMVVMRPTLHVELGLLLVLFSSLIWSIALLVIKTLSRDDSSLTIALYMGLFLAPLSAVPAAFVWTWPAPGDYLWLALIGSAGTLYHLLTAQAFREADASMVLPADFTRLVWASLLGLFFFGEAPELTTWIGGALIFGSTTYIALREARLARAAAKVPATPLPGPPAGQLAEPAVDS